ncbi:MAG TPA: TolC family protein [Thermoanaerobaculia bacterium]|nr:TolC family protein [Thermoanaerobaculia bacterium]
MAFLAAVSAAAQETDWKTRLGAAIGNAVARNPELGAMEARVEAARHRVGQAGALPDPEIEIGIKDIPVSNPSLTRSDFTMEVVSARQMFPGAGKRGTRRSAAEAEAGAVAAEHVVHVRSLAADVADAFFALGELDARIQILEESRERLQRAAASATERYRVGKGAQADVLRANLETTSVEERLGTLRAERRKQAARFNALQLLSPDSPVAQVALPSEEPPAARREEILRRAEEESPSVAQATSELRRAEEGSKLARLERRPDFTAMTYYGRRERFEDLAGASIAFNLPFVQSKRLSERAAEAGANLSGARAGLEVARNGIRRGVEEAYADLDRNASQIRLYRDSILPQAETNYRAAAEAYAVGQIDFLTYIRSATDLDAYRGDLAMRQAGAWRALAALQRASGLPLVPVTPQSGDIHVQK